MWTTKQKRCYHRMLSGANCAQRGQRLRFITLTSAPGMHEMHQHFRMLVKRIRRKYGSFEYIRVSTSEGNGVMHILYKGGFIPHNWLCRTWADIHNSPITDIREVRFNRGLGRYIVSQYLSAQRSAFQRYCWSWSWVYPGFVKNWKRICAYTPIQKMRLRLWMQHLKGFIIRLGNVKIPGLYSQLAMGSVLSQKQTFIDLELFSNLTHIPKSYTGLIAKSSWLK